VWISCYNNYKQVNVFVLPVDKVIKKYDDNMDYTDWNFYKQNTDKNR